MSEEAEFLAQIDNIHVWSNGDHRAVHKPFLILYALARFQKKVKKLLYEDIEEPIKELLEEYGTSGSNTNPAYPFWRLQKDGFWSIPNADLVKTTSSGDALVSSLRENNIQAGFSDNVITILENDESLIKVIAIRLLNKCFPSSWHVDIINSLGIELEEVTYKSETKKRDPKFRSKILTAYEHSCAICDMSIQLGNQFVILEAAHIKWHTMNGPDIESNGIAMCNLHHKLFDRGAFTLDDENKVIVSESVHGKGINELLLKYHGVKIREPIRKSYMPNNDFKSWHRREVFRGKGREI